MADPCDACGEPRHGQTIFCLDCLREFHRLQEEMEAEPHRTFFVYGSFQEPQTHTNAVVIRAPVRRDGKFVGGRQLWKEIRALVAPWFPPEQTRARDRRWMVDGEPAPMPGSKRLWDTVKFRRFEWTGTELIER